MSTRCEWHVREGWTTDRNQGGFVNALRVHEALTARL
jgi:hypothetical protein